MAHTVRSVNVVPLPKVRTQNLEDSDEEEELVQCRICFKDFASIVALGNHTRMEHTENFLNGETTMWTEMKVEQGEEVKNSEEKTATEKANYLYKHLGLNPMMLLASQDVRYIVVKSEDGPGSSMTKRKTDNPDKKHKQSKSSVQKVEKDPVPIQGPFECLQPSNHVSSGTCHQIFFSCCEYSIHCRDEHSKRRRTHRCQVCEKPLSAPDSDFFCDRCNTSYQNDKKLAEHRARVHFKRKQFECDICSKRFTQLPGLQTHKRLHTGYRPFSCNICHKTFTQKVGLEQHSRIHMKIRPYRCVVCSKTFSQSVHLKQHMRTHTKVSPFQCIICGKRFKQSAHLNYHLRLHNPGNMTVDQKLKYTELMGLMDEVEGIKTESDPDLNQTGFKEVGTEYVQETCVTDTVDTWNTNCDLPAGTSPDHSEGFILVEDRPDDITVESSSIDTPQES